MAIPALVAGAAKAYSAYKTFQDGKELLDSGGKLSQASERASGVLAQVKNAVHALDGGVSSREDGGDKGMEIDMPKLSGLFPGEPGEAAPGMTPDEHGFLHGIIANFIGTNEAAMGMEGQSPEAPQGPGR